MTKLLLAGSLLLSAAAFSQTTLFQDNFQAGAGNWTLNGGSGGNQWVVNAEYIGFSGIIDDTPDQPAGIAGSPNSSYMHVYNPAACGALGICNASFDSGSAANQPTTLTNSINATGYNTVTLSFWYLCEGATGVSYGTIEYSTDGGMIWTPTGTQYSGVSTWTQTSVTLPAWDNVAALKFRFRWQNGGSGNDPAFAIDDILVTGMGGSFASISTGTINPSSWCFNTAANITVAFTVTGTVNPGNVYTVQLSNSSGSFASPVNIGSLTSSATGTLSANATIPAGTAAGNGYRIRVTASDPATNGSDNGVNLAVHALPIINIIGNPANGTMCEGESVTMLASNAVNYSWSPSASLNISNQAQVIATPAISTMYTVTGIDANGCSNTATFQVTVDDCAGIAENNQTPLTLYPNPSSATVTLQYDAALDVTAVEVLDLNGRVIATAAPQETVVSVASLGAGSYLVRITHATGSGTARFIKQ